MSAPDRLLQTVAQSRGFRPVGGTRRDAQAHLTRLTVGGERRVDGRLHQRTEHLLHLGFAHAHDVQIAADENAFGAGGKERRSTGVKHRLQLAGRSR